MLPLTPRIAPITRSVLDEGELLEQLVEGFGSPVNVVLPQSAGANVARFLDVYRRRRLRGRIHFAHKANRSSALLRQLSTTDAGVDVSSLEELQHALSSGFPPDRILATGPKDRAFLWLAAQTGVTVAVDSLAEISDIPGRNAKIMIRLSGFVSHGVQMVSRRSRFGIPVGDLDTALDLIDGRAELVGLAYHLDTVAVAEKAVAFEGALAALDKCRARGLRPWTLDIGGGYGVNYLADGAQWERYTSALAQAVLGNRPPMTWNGHGYGLRAENGTLRGSLTVYPAHRGAAGADYLDQLLDTPAPGQRRPLGDLLLDHMYDLDVEPGRALLDQCGLVLTRVVEVRRQDGDLLVRVDANARDVSTEEHGVLMDPVLLGKDEGEGDNDGEGEERGAYLLGNLCLESDLITRRQVRLPRTPRTGDLLVFVNTAGYFMDFVATTAVRRPVTPMVALYRRDGRWRWCLDENYWPEGAP
ncbi:Y4yA family PLP-dependent enzyme [Actinoplanes sp. NBRC 101535]|uniref:Y4yA family PLP-dependent enzyme n=1 Tax=Actinoplanes sp. NBRC 101535 TaxID=3032196 RepID=UPI0025539FB9|nr:Y4yA family PLP-dependent enzyme [Actinoplanes sp. NBRC 101535]